MSMERYFLRPTVEDPDTSVLGAVDNAFNNEELLELSGEREGVAINLGLTVTRLTKSRTRGRVALRFSGVVRPDETSDTTDFIASYTADVIDVDDPEAFVQVEIRQKK